MKPKLSFNIFSLHTSRRIRLYVRNGLLAQAVQLFLALLYVYTYTHTTERTINVHTHTYIESLKVSLDASKVMRSHCTHVCIYNKMRSYILTFAHTLITRYICVKIRLSLICICIHLYVCVCVFVALSGIISK